MKRREFVRNGTSAALVAAVPHSPTFRTPSRRAMRRIIASSSGDPASTTTLRDPRVKELARNAVDAARSAGARYADVRLTNTMVRFITYESEPAQITTLGLNVRALVNGYWGWAATPTLSTDEAVRVARLATRFATLTASRGRSPTVELGTVPVVQDGDWTTPVKIDPFDLDLLELYEWFYGLGKHVDDIAAARHAPPSHVWVQPSAQSWMRCGALFQKQERVFASTEGTLLTQTVITTSPDISLPYAQSFGGPVFIPNFNTPVQAGWERIADTPIIELMQKDMDRADAVPPPPPLKPVDIGRYDCVFSGNVMAQLLSRTLAPATEVDRALGYEANAGGTSYLGPDPLAVLGTSITSPLVTVTADRSWPLGVATTKWDDEGVTPEDFTLVNNGVLQNYQVTREQAPWIAPWFEKQGRPVRSLGCAMAPDALSEPMQHVPNLTLHPGSGSDDEDSLVRDLEHGLHIQFLPNLQMDWQCLDGYAYPFIGTEIRHGRPVGRTQLPIGIVANPPAGFVFRSNEFWENIEVLGGPDSVVWDGTCMSTKGDPAQTTTYTVRAVPARVKQLAIIDARRKA